MCKTHSLVVKALHLCDILLREHPCGPFFCFLENKKRPWQKYTICQGRIDTFQYDTIRGATLIHSKTCALSRILTYSRQLTYANTSQNTRRKKYTFDYALSGPFDKLFLAWFSASQALCKGIVAVISASTVYNIIF